MSLSVCLNMGYTRKIQWFIVIIPIKLPFEGCTPLTIIYPCILMVIYYSGYWWLYVRYPCIPRYIPLYPLTCQNPIKSYKLRFLVTTYGILCNAASAMCSFSKRSWACSAVDSLRRNSAEEQNPHKQYGRHCGHWMLGMGSSLGCLW